MSYSLETHTNKYNLSPCDIFLSTCTGFSGMPYAIRHWELSQAHTSKTFLGHRIIALLECLPLIGGVAALLERIAACAYDSFSQQTPVTPPPERGGAMIQNQTILPLYERLHSTPEATLHPFPGSDICSDKTQPMSQIKNTLVQENENRVPLPYKKYVRRFPPRSIDEIRGQHRSEFFIAEEEIVLVHPMRCIRPSPYWKHTQRTNREDQTFNDNHSGLPPTLRNEIIDSWVAHLNAIAQTEDGKHVILQQSTRSCVPTAIFMLILDAGKIPANYSLSTATNVCTLETGKQLLQQVKLHSILRPLSAQQDPLSCLEAYILEYGSGVLEIKDPTMGDHVIVVDAINPTNRTAQIRDSFHGWALTIRIECLQRIIQNDAQFLQISAHAKSKIHKT